MISLLKNGLVNQLTKSSILFQSRSFVPSSLIFSSTFCTWHLQNPALLSKSNCLLRDSLFPSFNLLETSLRHYHKHKWNQGKPRTYPPQWSNKRLPWQVRKEPLLNSNLDSDITPQNQQFLKVKLYNKIWLVFT